MIFFTNYITTVIIFTFLNNVFLTNTTKMFFEKPAKV